jgi:multicomponent Na+:H+ antiporter subunit E
MSPVVRTRRDGTKRPARYRAVQPIPILWLTLVWCTLWGSFSPMMLVGGVLVAVIVSVVFPLPALEADVRVRPLRLVWLVAGFLVDVVRASIQVTGVVLRRRGVRNAVVSVDLRSSSDFVLTGVAAMLSLVPGSVVVEVRRSSHTLFLHVLDVPDRAAAERFRQQALEVERKFLQAFPPKVVTAAPAEEVTR